VLTIHMIEKGRNHEENCGETERAKAKENLEKSLQSRRKRVDGINDFIDPDHSVDNEESIMAFILYELGKLFSSSILKEENHPPRTQLFFSIKEPTWKEGIASSLSYFEEARSILQGCVALVDTMCELGPTDDPWTARLQKAPIIYEDMLQTMAILYRKLDQYDKSVECYNEVSILLTRKKE